MDNPIQPTQSLDHIQPLGIRFWAVFWLLIWLTTFGALAGPIQNIPNGPYIISIGDQLDISVLGHDNLKASVTVLPDGTFGYPVIGTVHAAGKTAASLADSITTGLSGQLNQPQVTVTVRESQPGKISILGAVKAPGLYDYKPGLHVLEALATCGGPAQAPELTQATLIPAETKKPVALDITRLMSGSAPDEDLPLMPGDTLLVQERDPAVAQVQVIGEVTKPGAYSVPTDGSTVMSLLTQAGGTTPKAALSRAQIMHGGHVLALNLHPMMDSLNDTDGSAKLVAGDVLLIPANTARIGVLGEVHSPGAYDIPDGSSLTATSALLLAGGTTDDAARQSAGILRRGSDGKSVIVPVNMDALLKADSHTPDVALEPGDILYIPTRHKGQSGLSALAAISPLTFFAGLLR